MENPRPPGGGDGPGDGRGGPGKAAQLSAADEEENERAIPVLGDTNDLPMWVIIGLFALISFYFRSLAPQC